MNPWLFLLVGFPVTVAVETPILLLGLSRRHSWQRRLIAGVWLTACTYPIVILVLPQLLIQADGNRAAYLIVAETFAPLAECVLFWLAFGAPGDLRRSAVWRDFAAIIVANLASFAVGVALDAVDGWKTLFHVLGFPA